jgi:hypothetical protein
MRIDSFNHSESRIEEISRDVKHAIKICNNKERSKEAERIAESLDDVRIRCRESNRGSKFVMLLVNGRVNVDFANERDREMFHVEHAMIPVEHEVVHEEASKNLKQNDVPRRRLQLSQRDAFATSYACAFIHLREVFLRRAYRGNAKIEPEPYKGIAQEVASYSQENLTQSCLYDFFLHQLTLRHLVSLDFVLFEQTKLPDRMKEERSAPIANKQGQLCSGNKEQILRVGPKLHSFFRPCL